MPSRKLPAINQGLDSEVYTIVLRILEDPKIEATVPSLWHAIQRSNSSLRRRPKKLIESSLERVLESLAGDGSDSEDAIDTPHSKTVTEDPNIMNRALTGAWKDGHSASGSANGSQEVQQLPASPRPINEQRRKRKRDGFPEDAVTRAHASQVKFEDIGGADDIIKRMEGIIILPMLRPALYAQMAIPLPRGVLLHGPPGCGKSLLARACAGETRVPLVEILGPSIVSGMSGESEKQVRDAFEQAKSQAPCILFIDEIDVIAPKRDSSQSQMEKRIVAQLLLSMDDLELEFKDNQAKPVIVMAATNRPDSIDPALRRGGRFDTEINMGVPDEKTRAAILGALTKKTSLADDVDFRKLAKMTPGFVGADLRDLVGKAGTDTIIQYAEALKRQAERLMPGIVGPHPNIAAASCVGPIAATLPREGTDDLLVTNGHATDMDIDSESSATAKSGAAVTASIAIYSYRMLVARLRQTAIPEPEGFVHPSVSMASFLRVLPTITPSAKREGFATIPDTTWKNIGALQSVRQALQFAIVDPIRYPDRYEELDLAAPAGVLLCGPPGCGKTLLAKAVANESKANFIAIQGPELLNKFVGESERAIRTVFTRARSSVPCVVFFDEFDALANGRNEAGGSEASARVFNTLLTELDGLGDRKGIYVIAATNRPDMIDGAMLRPGRLDTLLYVDLPDGKARGEILEALLASKRDRSRWPEAPALAMLADRCAGFSGADLGSLTKKAGMLALQQRKDRVELVDFETALEEIKPSVLEVEKYARLKEKFGVRGSGDGL